MATSGMLPPPPADPEPWSEKDFVPITAFLRHQIGITLETHRMGLLQLVDLQKNFLNHVLRVRGVPQDSPGRGEHQRTVSPHDAIPVGHCSDLLNVREGVPLYESNEAEESFFILLAFFSDRKPSVDAGRSTQEPPKPARTGPAHAPRSFHRSIQGVGRQRDAPHLPHGDKEGSPQLSPRRSLGRFPPSGIHRRAPGDG